METLTKRVLPSHNFHALPDIHTTTYYQPAIGLLPWSSALLGGTSTVAVEGGKSVIHFPPGDLRRSQPGRQCRLLWASPWPPEGAERPQRSSAGRNGGGPGRGIRYHVTLTHV